MTNNEKMIALYGHSNGYRACAHCINYKNSKCKIGGASVYKWGMACGKFESNEKGESDA